MNCIIFHCTCIMSGLNMVYSANIVYSFISLIDFKAMPHDVRLQWGEFLRTKKAEKSCLDSVALRIWWVILIFIYKF